MGQRILVTGASGNIGTHLVKYLQEAGADFSVMRSKETRFENVAALTQAFKGVDTLFVLLPLVEQKLRWARNVAQAAQQAGIKHLVRSSGAGADANARFALPLLQGQIDQVFEDAGKAAGFTTTFVRPAGFMQNFASFLAGQVKAGTVYAALGEAKQSLIDLRDIAEVAAKVLMDPSKHAGQAYTLTGGESLSTASFIQTISKEIGRPVSYQAVPFEAASQAMNQMGMPAWMVELMDSLNRIVAAGYAQGISPDVQNILGRAPITTAQFAKDYRNSWL